MVEAGEALSIGIALSVISVAMLGLATNWVAAGLLAFTIFFYAVIYTMWLKRLTPQNIVIGGAAGAFPPMIGWAAVTGSVSLEAILMFGLIFMWTPPHFWALALFMKADYHEAKVPMLTVTHGRAETRRQIWIYSLLLAPVALGLGLTSIAGPVYLAAAVVLNAIFLIRAFAVWRRDEATAEADGFSAEKASVPFLAELPFPSLRRASRRFCTAPDGRLGGLTPCRSLKPTNCTRAASGETSVSR